MFASENHDVAEAQRLDQLNMHPVAEAYGDERSKCRNSRLLLVRAT